MEKWKCVKESKPIPKPVAKKCKKMQKCIISSILLYSNGLTIAARIRNGDYMRS